MRNFDGNFAVQRATQAMKGTISFFAVMLSVLVFGHVVYAQWWNPFAPKDYEACAESAAKDAKSKAALSVLLSLC